MAISECPTTSTPDGREGEDYVEHFGWECWVPERMEDDERYQCGDPWHNWVCTRRRGHSGDHVGHNDPHMAVARWRPANPYADLEIGPDVEGP